MVFDDLPINKPHGLNVALRQARTTWSTIFDAEDEIHPDIVSVVNTVMVNEGVKVVQGGVQLMNYESNWYSTLNVLEYFFWFKSRLHYHARHGSIPLGGNTVFFSRDLLNRHRRLGRVEPHRGRRHRPPGERMGERIRVIYDDRYVTKEETPPTLAQFIKQRTRWSQGFMQTLAQGRVEADADAAAARAGVLHARVPARPGHARAVRAVRAVHDVRGARSGAGGDAVVRAGPVPGRALSHRGRRAVRVHRRPPAEGDARAPW